MSDAPHAPGQAVAGERPQGQGIGRKPGKNRFSGVFVKKIAGGLIFFFVFGMVKLSYC
jgi:hypothetical protein